jgi:hypothetical protein
MSSTLATAGNGALPVRLLSSLGKIRVCQVLPDTEEECPAYLAWISKYKY